MFRLFDTPLIMRSWRSLPLTELVVWIVMAGQAGRRRPERTRGQRLGVGFLAMIALLKWEWLHNLAHAAAARWVGKPMDAIQITFGMPLCIYSVDNHRSATPRQHILRAMGGPLFNLAAMVITRMLLRTRAPVSLSHELLDVAVGMNTFLAAASLLPIPGIDGGPILKWSLVAAGKTSRQADRVVRGVDLAISPGLGLLAGFHFRKGRRVSGLLAASLSLIAFAVGLGWMRDET